MDHWNTVDKAFKGEEDSGIYQILSEAIDDAWDVIRYEFGNPAECGMMPESPVEYHENAVNGIRDADRDLQFHENCLSCLCDEKTWDQKGKHCNM